MTRLMALTGCVLSAMAYGPTAIASGDGRGTDGYRQQRQVEVAYYDDGGYRSGPTHDGTYYDYARVIRVEPIVGVVPVARPREYCWDEEVEHEGYSRSDDDRIGSFTPIVIGGILGGVLGNQLGSGSGNELMTVGGALLGASLGYGQAHSRSYQPPYYPGPYVTRERRCQVANEYHDEQQVEGYRVTYVYQGQQYVRRLDHHPGSRVRVRVSVTPAE